MSYIFNSTLQRKKPLKSKGRPWAKKPLPDKKPKNQLKKITKSLRKRKREYYPLQRQFLEDHPFCQICEARGAMPPNRSTEVHHKFGRIGSLLCDVRGFVASCFPCRDFPHSNPKKARELGVLGEARYWNVPIDRH